MIRFRMSICLLLAISLASVAIWPSCSIAAQVPQLQLLGEVKDILRVPTRLAVDRAGNLYVADARAQKIVKFDKFGRRQLVLDQVKISGAGLAVSDSGERIYASAGDKVVVFSAAGELLDQLGFGAGEFVAAGPIALDSLGTIYVADLGRGLVKSYRPDGSSVGSLSGASFVACAFLGIHPLSDAIYLPDSVTNSRAGQKPMVSIFAPGSSQPVQLFADRSFGSGAVQLFGGMAIDPLGRFFLSDVEGNSIRVLDENNSWLLTYTRNGELNRPGAMAYDPSTGRLFVIQGENRVEIYGIDGASNPELVNSVPEVPQPLAPIGGSEVASLRPALQFNNALDADVGDQLSYNVQVFDHADLLVAEFSVAEQPGSTSVQLTSDLQENALYHWQVQAFDGKAVSAWSPQQSFYVNATEEAPSQPVLTSPLAALDVRGDAVLTWQAASDADPFDTLSYLLEVASDAAFSDLLYQEQLDGTERAITDWSEAILPGQTCYWRVTAIDNHGLSAVSSDDGRFRYQATLLKVTANMPAARVYLGGNYGYAGQLLGEAPLELRDLPEGQYQLVVERAGFEPFYLPVELQLSAPTEVAAVLQPARQPNLLRFKPLKVAGKPVRTGAQLTPLLADLDLDGVEDLLLAQADGSLHYHPGVLLAAKRPGEQRRRVQFGAEEVLALPQLPGGTPALVDWNNDYLQDLLIGTADGSVWLFLNQGDFVFSQVPELLAAVSSTAVPVVCDLDADGDKDLLVGSGNGELVLFLNLGSDAVPQLGAAQALTTFAGAVAPSLADWNGDGRRELLLASEGQLYRGSYLDGALSALSPVPVGGAEIARLFAHELDNINGKELLAATPTGDLLLGHSRKNGRLYVADFYLALNEKLQQLELLMATDAAELLAQLQPLFASLEAQKIGRLKKQLAQLIFDLPVGTESVACANELAVMLEL